MIGEKRKEKFEQLFAASLWHGRSKDTQPIHVRFRSKLENGDRPSELILAANGANKAVLDIKKFVLIRISFLFPYIKGIYPVSRYQTLHVN